MTKKEGRKWFFVKNGKLSINPPVVVVVRRGPLPTTMAMA